MIEQFFGSPNHLKKGEKGLASLDKLPSLVRNLMPKRITKKQMAYHFSQVIPIEDVEQILETTTSVVRLACICRETGLGSEQRFCYGLSLAPEGGEIMNILKGIDTSYLIGP